MLRLPVTLTLALTVVATSPATASTPTADEVVDRMVAAAGGADAFSQLGVIRLDLDVEETTTDGTRHEQDLTAYVSTRDMRNFRLELPSGAVVVRHDDTGWALMQGKLDERPQTPRMAKGVVHGQLFPLLLPFSLQMEGVQPQSVEETTFEGRPAWRLRVGFDDLFFANPMMNSPWTLHVARDDASLLGAEFSPPEALVQKLGEGAEGMRIRHLTHAEMKGVRLPRNVLVDGVDPDGMETGHVRVMKVSTSMHAPWDMTLFLDPKTLERFEK